MVDERIWKCTDCNETIPDSKLDKHSNRCRSSSQTLIYPKPTIFNAKAEEKKQEAYQKWSRQLDE